MVKVTFQLTADDYWHGLSTWRRMRAWRRWMVRLTWTAISLIVGLSLVGLAIRPSASNLQNVAPAIGIGLAWLLLMWAAPRHSARKQFRGTPSAQNPMTIDASDSGVNTHSFHGESQVAWSAYVGWAEDKSVFIILPQPRIYVPIPKRAFSAEQLDEFREILRRNVGSTKSR